MCFESLNGSRGLTFVVYKSRSLEKMRKRSPQFFQRKVAFVFWFVLDYKNLFLRSERNCSRRINVGTTETALPAGWLQISLCPLFGCIAILAHFDVTCLDVSGLCRWTLSRPLNHVTRFVSKLRHQPDEIGLKSLFSRYYLQNF